MFSIKEFLKFCLPSQRTRGDTQNIVSVRKEIQNQRTLQEY